MPQGDVCRPGKRWEYQLSSDNKVVSECVQTYQLYRLCHRVMFAGQESDGKINQVQTTKWSMSVPQGDVCRPGKRWENQSCSDNKVVNECATG